MVKRSIRTVALALVASFLVAVYVWAHTNKNAAQTDLPRTRLHIGHVQLDVQIATTRLQQQKGLMHRTHMPDDEGMLFVFEQTERLCFWMKNTPLHLTVAFIAADGRIVSLSDMQAWSEQQHCSPVPVRFALEMQQGWFARHNILPGMRIADAQGRMFSQ